MARTRRRYGWSLAIPYGDPRLRSLSPAARFGLEYARKLARNARERRREALLDPMLPKRLTVEAIAREEETSPIEIHRQIKRARIEIFGKDLSDSAIYTRLRQPRDEGRSCAEPGCGRGLPLNSSRARRYCVDHSREAARVRRHRRRRAGDET